MSMKLRVPVALLVALLFAWPVWPAHAQDPGFQNAAVEDRATFSPQELDQILAPIALYPDDLLSNILMASTYPLEVVEAARWIDEPENRDLKGAALESALANKDWDPSVKSLTQFPDVLAMMSEQLDWMRDLGDVVLADQGAVMDRIQFLRMKAEDAGNLKSNNHLRVATRREDDRDYIYIEPAEPDVVYVPIYEPSVYGPWWYPDYPPYYWGPGDLAFVNFFYWGTGIVIAPTLWNWSRPYWRRHYIHVDRRRFNRLTRHKLRPGVNRWHHNAIHRRGVRYPDPKLRRRHQRDSIKGARTKRLYDRGPLRGTNVPKVNRHRHPEVRKAVPGTPHIRKPGNEPAVKKHAPPQQRFTGQKKSVGPKGNKPPKKQFKKGPGPGIKKKPAVKKHAPTIKKQHHSGPRKVNRPSGGKKSAPKMRAPGGGPKGGAQRGGGGGKNKGGGGRGKDKKG